MRIISVIKDSVYEGNKTLDIIGHFTKTEDALKCLENEYSKAKEDYSYQNQDKIVYDYDEEHQQFDIYEDGFYDANHITCSIVQHELRTEEEAIQDEKNDSIQYFATLVGEFLETQENDGQSEFPKLTDEEKKNVVFEVARHLLADEDMWGKIDECISYYLYHHTLIMQKRGDE